MDMNKLKRNIKIDYIYSLLTSIDIGAAIWVLYLGSKGMSLAKIGLLEGIFHVTSFICEIPTGAIADILGRKKTIVAGRLMLSVSAVLMLISNCFLGFAASFIIQAIAYNLNSGSEEALVYDSLKITGSEEKYVKINGTINFIIEVGQGIAVFIGGILSDYSFTYCYVIAVIISLCGFGISLGFTEAEVDEKNHGSITVIGHFKECINVVKSNIKIILMMMYFEIIFMTGTAIHFYSQEFFSIQGYSRSMISVIFVAASIASALGAKIVYRLQRRYGKKLIWMLPMAAGVILLPYVFSAGALSCIVFVGFSAMINMLYPVSSNYINSLIPSKQRATLISVQSMCFSCFMILFFPILGYIGDVFSLRWSFAVLNVVLVVMAFTGILIVKKES